MWECCYCTPKGEVAGVIEILRKNRAAIFTPSSDPLVSTYQCIIHLGEIAECRSQDDKFLVIRPVNTNGDFVFKFKQQGAALDACRDISSIVSPAEQDIAHESREEDFITIGKKDKPGLEFRGEFLIKKYSTQIRDLLPFEFRFSQLRLLFSPKIHGISIPSFYRRTETLPYPSIVILRDSFSDCCVFGAFCKSPWILSNSRRYFGSPDNFLFSLSRSSVIRTETFSSLASSNKWFQFCDDQRLVIGGGDGMTGPAISIFSNWLRGSSLPCPTFGSQHSLACSQDFVVGDIEFWALLPDSDDSPSVPVSY